MKKLKKQFISDFSAAMLENNAAIFAGAGLSVLDVKKYFLKYHRESF